MLGIAKIRTSIIEIFIILFLSWKIVLVVYCLAFSLVNRDEVTVTNINIDSFTIKH